MKRKLKNQKSYQLRRLRNRRPAVVNYRLNQSSIKANKRFCREFTIRLSLLSIKAKMNTAPSISHFVLYLSVQELKLIMIVSANIQDKFFCELGTNNEAKNHIEKIRKCKFCHYATKSIKYNIHSNDNEGPSKNAGRNTLVL